MLQHLLSCLGMNERITNVEKDVPELFSLLGYPVKVTSTTLKTLSASHSWPHMLAALSWLAMSINLTMSDIDGYLEGTDDDLAGDDNDETLIRRQQVLSFITINFFKLVA
jgi:kinetochore protein NDC80